jgi:hypothetical protein
MNKSYAPFKYLADKMTQLKNVVKTISPSLIVVPNCYNVAISGAYTSPLSPFSSYCANHLEMYQRNAPII